MSLRVAEIVKTPSFSVFETNWRDSLDDLTKAIETDDVSKVEQIIKRYPHIDLNKDALRKFFRAALMENNLDVATWIYDSLGYKQLISDHTINTACMDVYDAYMTHPIKNKKLVDWFYTRMAMDDKTKKRLFDFITYMLHGDKRMTKPLFKLLFNLGYTPNEALDLWYKKSKNIFIVEYLADEFPERYHLIRIINDISGDN